MQSDWPVFPSLKTFTITYMKSVSSLSCTTGWKTRALRRIPSRQQESSLLANTRPAGKKRNKKTPKRQRRKLALAWLTFYFNFFVFLTTAGHASGAEGGVSAVSSSSSSGGGFWRWFWWSSIRKKTKIGLMLKIWKRWEVAWRWNQKLHEVQQTLWRGEAKKRMIKLWPWLDTMGFLHKCSGADWGSGKEVKKIKK